MKKQKRRKIMRIVISSGHGLHVNGAIGIINERDENRRVTKRVCELLRNAGRDVIEFHEDIARNQRDNVNNIIRFHNSQTRDLDVSIHFNAVAGIREEGIGVETMFRNGNNKMHSLASNVSRAIAKVSGLILRRGDGTWGRDNEIGFLRELHNSILIEVCFVNSRTDVRLYQENFEAICHAIAETIVGEAINTNSINVMVDDHALIAPSPENGQVQWRVRYQTNDGRQIGAFSVWANAVAAARNNAGFKVFDMRGNMIFNPYCDGINTPNTTVVYNTNAPTQSQPFTATLEEIQRLEALVWAEARGEVIEGQIAVANVVINRVRSTDRNSFPPNDIIGIINQPGQFTPVTTGIINQATPNTMQREAVRRALTGEDYSQGALFFDKTSAINGWVQRNRPHLFTLGGHSFHS